MADFVVAMEVAQLGSIAAVHIAAVPIVVAAVLSAAVAVQSVAAAARADVAALQGVFAFLAAHLQ